MSKASEFVPCPMQIHQRTGFGRFFTFVCFFLYLNTPKSLPAPCRFTKEQGNTALLAMAAPFTVQDRCKLEAEEACYVSCLGADRAAEADRAGGIRAGKAGGAGAGRARLWYGGQAGLEQGELDMGRGGMQCELMQGHRGVSAADVSHRASLYAKLGVLLDHDL